jgi:hypothetical protein
MTTTQARTEWEAWQGVCAELKKLGVDINMQDPLNDALKMWAVCFHEFQMRRFNDDKQE